VSGCITGFELSISLILPTGQTCLLYRYPSASLRAGSEQLTYLLFLKMADERSRPPYNQASPVLAGYDWQRLAPSLALPRKRERGFSWGDELFDHYRHTLDELGKQKGLLGPIFTKSQNKLAC
jgi:type I restriction enzyme M protein